MASALQAGHQVIDPSAVESTDPQAMVETCRPLHEDSASRHAQARISRKAVSNGRSSSSLRRIESVVFRLLGQMCLLASMPHQERVKPFVQQDGGDIEFVRSSLSSSDSWA